MKLQLDRAGIKVITLQKKKLLVQITADVDTVSTVWSDIVDASDENGAFKVTIESITEQAELDWTMTLPDLGPDKPGGQPEKPKDGPPEDDK